MTTSWTLVGLVSRMAIIVGLASLALPANAQDCEVKIGVAGPMTGGGAAWGLSERAGTAFEAEYTNAAGGLAVGDRRCKVSVVSVDTQATSSGGAAASNYLASQSVHAVVGPITTPEATGFKPVSKRNGQVSFSTSFAKDIISPDYPLAFHKVLGPWVWGPELVRVAKSLFHLKSVIVVGPNDSGGTDSGMAEAAIYQAAGIDAGTEWFQRGTTNFAAIAARVMRRQPDGIEVGPVPPADGAVLIKQLREAGYGGAFLHMGSGSDIVLKNAGGIDAKTQFIGVELVPTQDPGILKMNADFARVMKTPIPDNSLVYCAEIAAEQILQAISLAGTDQDGEKIAAALRTMTPQSRYLGNGGWRGQSQYGINQELAFPVGLDVVVDGQVQPQRRLDTPSETPAAPQ